jgi:tetratricopeptide (TPR) repeat protein
MLTNKARLLILLVSIALLGFTAWQRVYELTAAVGLGIMLLLWSWLKQGTVALASKAYHAQDFEKAERLLKQVISPDRLARNRRGYYEFISGNIELKKGNYEAAETHFQIASRFRFRTQNEKGLLLAQLANLNILKKDFIRARAYAEKAREMDISARVKSILDKIDNEIKRST